MEETLFERAGRHGKERQLENKRRVSESPSVTVSVPELICTVCLEAYEGEEGCTYLCDVCGRGGFCKDCAKPQDHDCE